MRSSNFDPGENLKNDRIVGLLILRVGDLSSVASTQHHTLGALSPAETLQAGHVLISQVSE